MKCGLLGRKLGHSYSPQIHKYLGHYTYRLFEIEPEEIGDFIISGDYSGINVTIPYKKDVLPYCTKLSETAQKLGAVNTVVRKKDGSIIGHNTDYFGFYSMLCRSKLNVTSKKVLVLGTGGASATAQAVLTEQNANVVVISRNGANNYDNLYLHADASVIVNCTPVGMYPNTGMSPVNLSQFPLLEGVLHIIYNPARTKLLLDAEERGLVSMNGLWMLVAQAKESAEWFLGKNLDNSLIEKVYLKLKQQMQNIVLIGMPGCGKSTVGQILAGKLDKEFADADKEITDRAGCSIPQIFEKGGEPAFRTIETDVLSDLGKESGLVIATGGGCVTRDVNYPLLHQNGIIIWIQRSLSSLAKEGRPLSAATSAEEMYAVRQPMYARFADFTVLNNGAPEETATEITRILGDAE